MKHYELSNNWKSLGFDHQKAERGCLELYTYDATEKSSFDDRTFRFRATVIIDTDSGKPCDVSVNFFAEKNCLFYNTETANINNYSGLYCEEICLEFLKKQLYAFNTLLNTHFTIQGLPERTRGLW